MSEEQVSAPEVENVEVQEPVVESPDIRRIKIDGEYVDVPISELEASYGLQKSSNKRFEEAAHLRKEVDELLDTFQRGDLSALKEFIPEDKLYDYAESLLRKKIEWEETPEEQKARILAEKERDELKSQLEEYSKKEQEQIINYANDLAAEELDSEIGTALEKLAESHGTIVNTPEFIQDVARIMLAQLESGAGNVDSDKAAQMALKKWKSRFGKYVGGISQDELGKFLTKEQIARLRKSDLDTALNQFPEYGKKGGEKISRKKDRRMNLNDYFSTLDQQLA